MTTVKEFVRSLYIKEAEQKQYLQYLLQEDMLSVDLIDDVLNLLNTYQGILPEAQKLIDSAVQSTQELNKLCRRLSKKMNSGEEDSIVASEYLSYVNASMFDSYAPPEELKELQENILSSRKSVPAAIQIFNEVRQYLLSVSEDAE